MSSPRRDRVSVTLWSVKLSVALCNIAKYLTITSTRSTFFTGTSLLLAHLLWLQLSYVSPPCTYCSSLGNNITWMRTVLHMQKYLLARIMIDKQVFPSMWILSTEIGLYRNPSTIDEDWLSMKERSEY